MSYFAALIPASLVAYAVYSALDTVASILAGLPL